jgi:1-deoxy-D-xylulose-5-phosphate reductoisomerase
LNFAYYAARKGYTTPAVMNAANETAVAAFLNKEIKFTDIAKIVGKTVKTHKISKNTSLDTFIEADCWARQYTEKLINEI